MTAALDALREAANQYLRDIDSTGDYGDPLDDLREAVSAANRAAALRSLVPTEPRDECVCGSLDGTHHGSECGYGMNSTRIADQPTPALVPTEPEPQSLEYAANVARETWEQAGRILGSHTPTEPDAPEALRCACLAERYEGHHPGCPNEGIPDDRLTSAADTEVERLRRIEAAALAYIEWFDSPGRSYRRDGAGAATTAALRSLVPTEPDPMLGTPADGRHPDHGDCGQKPCPHVPAAIAVPDTGASLDAYDEAVERVHRAFCDPAHELVGPWDEEMAAALRRNGYLIVKAERHFYEGDGESPCSEPCGGPEQGDPRHFTDGDA